MISVDLVVCIRVNGWPKDSNVKDHCDRSHPGYEMIRKLLKVDTILLHPVSGRQASQGLAGDCHFLERREYY